MRYLMLIVWVCAGLVSKAGVSADTVTYWTISYDKALVIRGNVTQAQVPKYELTVKEGLVKDLSISFVYDNGQPKVSSLVVKEKNEELRTIESNPDIGGCFVVPVKELIGTHQTGVRYELDFYYTDNRGEKGRKLGTITFIFK